MRETLNRRQVLLSASLLVGTPLLVGDAPARLFDPFDPKRTRKNPIDTSITSQCTKVQTPVVDLIGTKYYIDKKNSIVDPALLKKNQQSNDVLTAFVNSVEKQASSWLSSVGRNHDAADCGLDYLRQWANGSALLGRVNSQGEGAQRWNATGLAVAYLAMRHSLPDKNDALISAWLLSLGQACRSRGAALENNHLNWTAAAAATTAIASNSRTLWEWSLAAATRCIAKIQPDGSLPLEIARGPRALRYHSFALAPLLLCAELALVNGQDLYGESNSAISRLAHFVLRNFQNPSEIQALAQAEQEKIWVLPWLPIWQRRNFDDEMIGSLTRKQEPIWFPYMGGDQGLLFGA